MPLAVVVAWDGRRADWLRQALTSIDTQSAQATERCLVIDTSDIGIVQGTVDYALEASGWIVRSGAWQDPAASRNEGIRATTAPWILFWDAHNVMPQDFVAATRTVTDTASGDVGIVYSDIEYVDDDQLSNPFCWRVPDWDYWQLRASNYIDTASSWRRAALELAGCWPEGLGSFEDFALALEVTRRGWTAQRREGPPVVMRTHRASRSQERTRNGQEGTDQWSIRSLGIVSLLAGRMSTYERWQNFLLKAELPRHAGIYIVDNSADPEFARRVHQTAHDLAASRDLDHVTVSARPQRYPPATDEGYFYRDRHLHVARLYSEVLPTVTEDLVLTLEDDVEPPPDAVRRLTEQMSGAAGGRLGAIAAAYDMGDDALCAGRADGGWGTRIPWSEVGGDPFDVGCVGGGCTLWANWALVGQPIRFRWDEGLGWDGSLCTDLRRRGYAIQVHGGVQCIHHVHGVIRTA